jgi:hypothetical protein
MMAVRVKMAAILPGYTVETSAETSFCLAETVIIGEVPSGYASIPGAAPVYLPVRPQE